MSLNISDHICSSPFLEVKYCILFFISLISVVLPFPLSSETQLSQLLRPCNRHSWKDSEAVPVTPLDSLYQSFGKPDSVIREQMAYQKAPVLASNYTFNAHLNFKHGHKPGIVVSVFLDYWAQTTFFEMLYCKCYLICRALLTSCPVFSVSSFDMLIPSYPPPLPPFSGAFQDSQGSAVKSKNLSESQTKNVCAATEPPQAHAA